MGAAMCTCCSEVAVQKNILFVGRTGAGKTHTLYQMLGEVASLDTRNTPVMNNEKIIFRRFGRCYEFWDPSGAEAYIPFWESLYKNVTFNVVIYVIDARKYWNKDERGHQVMLDRMEVHNILCAPEFKEAQFILYLNWKTDLDLSEERNLMEAIPEELELYTFPSRDVIVVDTFQVLLETLLSLPLDSSQGPA